MVTRPFHRWRRCGAGAPASGVAGSPLPRWRLIHTTPTPPRHSSGRKGDSPRLVAPPTLREVSLLRGEALLSEERIRLLLSWRHSGFSVHTSVTVPPDDREGLERLARYLLRPPVSLERLHVDEHAQAIAYVPRCKPGFQAPTAAPAEPEDFLARVVMHIPDPRRHTIRYYGAYSSVVRARRRREAPAPTGTQQVDTPASSAATAPTDPDMRALRRRWAHLLRRIFEVDPLVCPRCGETPNKAGGTAMRIAVPPPALLGVAFITEPRVITKILRHLATEGAD